MKILELNKKTWSIIALVMILVAGLLMLLNKLSFDNYLEMKEEFVEVDCTVISTDDIKRTITVAYVYDNIEYYVELQTIEYKTGDYFVAVIRPGSPKDLRFDNGYDAWNFYTYSALVLSTLAACIYLLILKRLFIKAICIKKNKTTLSITEIKDWHNFKRLVVTHNEKTYKSEIFKSFDNINKLEPNAVINLYINGPFHYVDLSSYKKIY